MKTSAYIQLLILSLFSCGCLFSPAVPAQGQSPAGQDDIFGTLSRSEWDRAELLESSKEEEIDLSGYDFLALYANEALSREHTVAEDDQSNLIENMFAETRASLKLESELDYLNKDYQALLETTGQFLKSYGPDPDILFKKALALYKSGKATESLSILNGLRYDPVLGRKAELLRREITLETHKKEIFIRRLFYIFSADRLSSGYFGAGPRLKLAVNEDAFAHHASGVNN